MNCSYAKASYWFSHRKIWRYKGHNTKTSKRNASGSGRPRSKNKQAIFDRANQKFEYYRYTLHMPTDNHDIVGFLNEAGDEIAEEKNDDSIKYNDNLCKLRHDTASFKSASKIKLHSACHKKKYNNEYIIPLCVRWLRNEKTKWTDKRLNLFEGTYFDEISLGFDFNIKNNTYSYENRNERVVSVHNYKTTRTVAIFWDYGR